MQVVVKRSVLFKALKKILNENRTGHSFYSDGSFLGRFEEEEERKDFINSDVPLRPSPTASIQLHADNFDVTDPEFIPSSKSSFLSAASAVLEHVPEGQIEKVYEKLHSLLDEAHEDEDKKNYGSLQEILTKVLYESNGSRSDEMLQIAASKYAKGDNSYLEMIDDIAAVTPGMSKEDIEDKIADLALSIMTQQTSQEQPKPAKRQRSTPVQTSGGRTVIRRRAKPEPVPEVPEEYEVEDLSFSDRAIYDASEDKAEFMRGYNRGADDAAFEEDEADVSGESADFAAGYSAGYNEMLSDFSEYSGSGFDLDDDSQTSQERMSQRQMFSEEVPDVLRLIPEFFMLCQDIGYKIETDRYNLMMSGDDPKSADKNIRQVYNIAHTETFINHNLLKSYFTKDYALRSARKHFEVIMDGRYNSPESREFKRGFISALVEDGYEESEGKNLLIQVFVDKILQDVAEYDYEPDQEARLKNVLRSEFASTTVYKTGTAAGPGGSQRASAKPYQGNTSATFYRRVKEEYRQDIIEDFLDRLTNKYLSGDSYKIPSGRKDPDNPKRNERYSYDPISFKSKAENYANELIDKALQDQRDAAQGKVITPEDEIQEPVLGDEQSPEAMSDEEVAEKLSNTRDFQTLAPFFGFSGAPGMRQWFLKFAKRFFEMGVISAKSGDRTLLKFHSEMVEAVLETLSEKIPDLMTDLTNEDDGTGKYQEMMAVFQRMAPQIESAYQEFLDVGDDLSSIVVTGKQPDGSEVSMPFLDTLGGQLARTVNGMFFKKVLTKLDKAWTDYVAEQLQTNEQFRNYIADTISDRANIDAKAAKSLAEYFIGKKNAPVILTNNAGTQRVYKSEAEGNPTKGVRALMKYGIDANAYHMINQESQDYFEDMLMTDFAKVVDFEGQYRAMILKDYEKLRKNNKEFRKVVMTALDDVIVGSSQRMAMSDLSDYEVEK